MAQANHILIIGGGLSGLLSALAMSHGTQGPACDVTLIDAADINREANDSRVTALTPSAMRMLTRLGLKNLSGTPMMGMRVGDGAAETPWQFELPERADDPLAINVENTVLREAILDRLSESSVTLKNRVRVTDLKTDGLAHVSLDDGTTLTGALVIAADGRNSTIRRLSGLSVSTHDFRQSALVTTVCHAEPHDGIALQRFQTVGAVASLPLATTASGHRSQIIWSDRRAAIDAACQLPNTSLIDLIDQRLWHALDVTSLDAAIQTYPLTAQKCEALSSERVALIGDAARIIHPLAGQGFNLSIRDIAALADGIRDAKETGQDIGTAGLIGYERWRRSDEVTLGTLTTALASAPKRGPLSLLGHLRRVAFAAVDDLPALHGFIRKEAIGETGDRPSLLR